MNDTGGDFDIFDLLNGEDDAETGVPSVVLSPDDAFVSWFLSNKVDDCIGYIRSMLGFLDYADESRYSLSETAPNGKIIRVSYDARVRLLLKYCIEVLYSDIYHRAYGARSVSPINLDVCVSRIMVSNKFSGISVSSKLTKK